MHHALQHNERSRRKPKKKAAKCAAGGRKNKKFAPQQHSKVQSQATVHCKLAAPPNNTQATQQGKQHNPGTARKKEAVLDCRRKNFAKTITAENRRSLQRTGKAVRCRFCPKKRHKEASVQWPLYMLPNCCCPAPPFANLNWSGCPRPPTGPTPKELLHREQYSTLYGCS